MAEATNEEIKIKQRVIIEFLTLELNNAKLIWERIFNVQGKKPLQEQQLNVGLAESDGGENH